MNEKQEEQQIPTKREQLNENDRSLNASNDLVCDSQNESTGKYQARENQNYNRSDENEMRAIDRSGESKRVPEKNQPPDEAKK